MAALRFPPGAPSSHCYTVAEAAEGAILQVSAPTLVPGGVCAEAGDTQVTASAISASPGECFNMTGLFCSAELPQPVVV